MMSLLLLFIVLSLFILNESKPNYCLPTDKNCWPTQSEIMTFSSKLIGELLTSSNGSQYDHYVNMTENLLYRNQYPSFIIICADVSDIQQSILFASTHNIQISMISTGHSWSGVSTANYSLQINFSKMTKFKVNDTDPNNMTITVETGVLWGSIYGIVDQYGHSIVIGPADPSVGPAGYALGGGHSPISPAFGLSTDFTTEYYMVDADANIIHVYNTSGLNTSIDNLFWALRGGGGGTFGAIINMTFQIHKPAENAIITAIQCAYSFYEYPIIRENYILSYILNNFFQLIQTKQLDPKWGGYLMVPLVDTQQNILEIDLIFYGDTNYAQNNGKQIFKLNEPYNNSINFNCSFGFFDNYLSFSSIIPPFTNGIAFAEVINDLIPIQNLTQQLADLMANFFISSNLLDGYIRAMTSVLIGGEVNLKNNDFTSVHTGFRQSAMEIGLSFYTSKTENISQMKNHSNEWQSKFWKYGYGESGAIYSNEQDYQCDGCDWKQMLFGNNQYQKLLKIKQKWDPKQVFWCHHCVGDDSN